MVQMGRLYLMPGELVVADQPLVVSTVLGSCVALTFFHCRQRLGAICHALLPYGPADGTGRYVSNAMAQMLEAFARKGIAAREIEVKLFGGAALTPQATASQNNLMVGHKNIAAAQQLAAAAGLKISVQQAGGQQGLRLRFYTATGEVWVQRMKCSVAKKSSRNKCAMHSRYLPG